MPQVIFSINFTPAVPPRNLLPKKKAELLARRSFYDGTAEFNYLVYILNDKKVVKNKDFYSYILRNGELSDINDNNSGLFSIDGVYSKDEAKEIQNKIKNSKSHIWHGVISFDQEASKGINTQEKAAHFMKQNFGALVERTHLDKDNLELFCALHKDTNNMHIHFAFYEKEPKRLNARGEKGYTSKGTFSKTVLENYLVSLNMYMNEHKYDYYTLRQRAIDRLKELKSIGVGQNQHEFYNHLLQLKKQLPTKGKTQYRSENMQHLRPYVDRIAELWIKSDIEAYKSDLALKRTMSLMEIEARGICTADVTKQFRYMNDAELSDSNIAELMLQGETELHRPNKISWSNIDYFTRLRADYKARLGNIVINYAKSMDKGHKMSTNVEHRFKSTFCNRAMKIAARERRRKNYGIVKNFLALADYHQTGIKADFTYALHQAQQEIEQQKYLDGENAQ